MSNRLISDATKANGLVIPSKLQGDVSFGVTELLKLCANGDIYVKGKLITNDMELVDGMREFLKLEKINRTVE